MKTMSLGHDRSAWSETAPIGAVTAGRAAPEDRSGQGPREPSATSSTSSFSALLDQRKAEQQLIERQSQARQEAQRPNRAAAERPDTPPDARAREMAPRANASNHHLDHQHHAHAAAKRSAEASRASAYPAMNPRATTERSSAGRPDGHAATTNRAAALDAQEGHASQRAGHAEPAAKDEPAADPSTARHGRGQQPADEQDQPRAPAGDASDHGDDAEPNPTNAATAAGASAAATTGRAASLRPPAGAHHAAKAASVAGARGGVPLAPDAQAGPSNALPLAPAPGTAVASLSNSKAPLANAAIEATALPPGTPPAWSVRADADAPITPGAFNSPMSATTPHPTLNGAAIEVNDAGAPAAQAIHALTHLPGMGAVDHVAAAPTFSVATPLGHPQFQQALGAQILLINQADLQRAEVHIHPAELGPIAVKLDMQGAQWHLELAADAPFTRQLLEAGLDSLSQQLQAEGLNLASAEVSSGDTQQAHSQWQDERQAAAHRPEPGHGRLRAAGDADAAAPDVTAAGATNKPVAKGRLDLYA